MKNLLKLKVLFLIFTIVLASEAIAAEQILPLARPTPDEQTQIKTAQKKHIYPQKRPLFKKEKAEIEESKKITDTKTELKEEVFIYPKKRPLIYQKKIEKVATKSTILSRGDFQIAKKIFEAIDKKNGKLL